MQTNKTKEYKEYYVKVYFMDSFIYTPFIYALHS